MAKFPETIYVTFDPNDGESPQDVLAFRRESDAIQEDGPTEVGVYAFRRAQRLVKKTVVDVPKKKK